MGAGGDVVRQLLAISRDVEPRLLVALRERGHDGLRPQYARFLYLVWDQPRPMGEIAEALGLSPQAASQLAGRIEAAGYVERRPNPADGRSRLVFITPLGRAVDDERARDAIATCEAHYAGIVGAPAVRDLVNALAALRDAFDVPAHPATARASLGVLPLVALAARDAVVDRIVAAGHPSVRPPHVEILPLVGEGCRPADVARAQGTTRQAASATLGEMEQLGYLRRRPDPDDQRAVLFVPTRAGAELLDADATARGALDAWFRTILTKRQDAALRAVAERLAAVLQPGSGELDELAHALRRRLGPASAARLAALLVEEER